MGKKVKPTGIDFVPAGPSDLERVLAFIKQYYEFDHIPFKASVIESGLKVLLAERSLGCAWIICANEIDVGYCVLTFGFDLEFGGRQATVTDLYIVEDYRRLGLGRRAMEFMEAFCRNVGLAAIELQVESNNGQAPNFYHALGFQAHNRVPRSKLL